MFELFSKKKKTIEKLKKRWGRIPQQEYTTDQLQALKYYYSKHVDSANDVDDITWNDLDMDSFYILINNTCSSMGEECLYSMLRKPYFDSATQQERDRVMEYIDANEEKRLELMYILASIGKVKAISLYEYINRLGSIEPENSLKHILMNLLYPVSILFLFLNPAIGLLLLIATISYSVFTYFSGKAKIDSYYSVIVTIMRTLKAAEKFEKIHIPELQEYQNAIKTSAKKLKTFNKGGFVVAAMKGGNIADLMLDYFRILTHTDLILFYRMLRIYREEIQALNNLYETFGFLDSMIACASFRRILSCWSKPELIETKKQPFLEIDSVYHPMIDNAVSNSIRTTKSVLLTGSNASGKSTFIKTVAINAVLSQTIATAICKSYRASFFRIASSMALTANSVA